MNQPHTSGQANEGAGPAQKYYRQVFDRLVHCFQFSDTVIAADAELAAAADDQGFPAVAEPLDHLSQLTCEKAYQVHIPVLGTRSQSVLMPIDVELFLGPEQFRLYADAPTHRRLFEQTIPVVRFLERMFRDRGLPYLLDYTPSGAHLLFQNLLGYRATAAVQAIGRLEDDLITACRFVDPADRRRRHGVSLDAALVFSGLARLAEYLALMTLAAFRDNPSKGCLPVMIGDAVEGCLNVDNSWCEGSPFMRCIRSPFSLHKKNRQMHHRTGQPPLVDVVGVYYDGFTAVEETDLDTVCACMWDLEKAAEHARRFSGYIPCSNETLIDFIDEYRRSDLGAWHRDFDRQKDLPAGAAIAAAMTETNIAEDTRATLIAPNPAALQPKRMLALVDDFLIHARWQARHIANILRDLYATASHGWPQDFSNYPIDEKANFWVRTYGAMALWRNGRLAIPADIARSAADRPAAKQTPRTKEVQHVQ
jgi:hypothetical protein